MENKDTRILFVQPFGHRAGHYSPLSKQLTDALMEAGVDVTMITFDGVWDNWIETSKIEQHISVVSRAGLLSPVLRQIPKLHRLPIAGVFADLAETLLTSLLALREARKQSYRAVHIQDGNPPFLPLALFTKNRNFAFYLHSQSFEWEIRGGLKKFSQSLRKKEYQYCLHLLMVGLVQIKPLQLLQRVVYQRALSKNSFFSTVETNKVKESFKTYLGGLFYNEIHVVPLGSAPPEANPLSQSEAREYLHLPQEAKLFLSFGGYHFHKNMEVIFEAVKGMPKTFYLIFAGKLATGDKTRDPLIVAQKYGWIDNTIVVSKFIPEAEKPYYFYAADAIIVSFVKGFTQGSMTINDACQYQLPVIASDVGQIGEDVKTYSLGVAFIPEDAESLRQAINSFLSLTDEERLTLKANLRRFASAFDTTEMAKRYVTLYAGEFSGGEE